MTEMLTAANTAVQFYAGGALFARVLFEEGTDEQKEFARMWAEKGWAGTMVLTEPDAGSDVGAGTTKAIDQGDGTWHIEGVKRFITSGEHDSAENIIHLVLARPEGAGPGTKGLSLFIVPKYLVNEDGSLGERNGVFATNIEKKMGLKGSSTCELTFGGEIPAVGYLVGDRRRDPPDVPGHRVRPDDDRGQAMGTVHGLHKRPQYAKGAHQGSDLSQASDKTAPRCRSSATPTCAACSWSEGIRRGSAGARPLHGMGPGPGASQPRHDTWPRRNDLLLPLVKGTRPRRPDLLALSLRVFGGSGYTQTIRSAVSGTPDRHDLRGHDRDQAMDLFFGRSPGTRAGSRLALCRDRRVRQGRRRQRPSPQA